MSGISQCTWGCGITTPQCHIYKIVDPHNYLLMTLDGKISQGLFEFERIKPATLRTSHGNVNTLAQLKQMINLGIVL